jgi:hypothetical protein
VRDLVPRRGVHRPPRHRRRPPPHADVAALPPAPRLPPAPDLALTRPVRSGGRCRWRRRTGGWRG